MTTRDRTREILDVKQRAARWSRFGAYSLQELQRGWHRSRDAEGCSPDFYIIRSVTLLEVFTRGNMADLIDYGQPFTDRAIELSKHFKMDFALVRDVQGRTITLGDIVAHSVPVSSFGQVVGYFETLLGKPVRLLLESAVDGWKVEAAGEPRLPIIDDFESLAGCLTRLFEVRHILCHEAPQEPAYIVSEIDNFLNRATQFVAALFEVLSFEKYGPLPRTQTEMNIAAGRDLNDVEDRLAHLLTDIRGKLSYADRTSSAHLGSETGATWLLCLEEAQSDWLAYRKAQCEFEAFPNRGGTIRPLVWATEAKRLTRLRIEELESWLKEASERYDFGSAG